MDIEPLPGVSISIATDITISEGAMQSAVAIAGLVAGFGGLAWVLVAWVGGVQ